MKSIYLHYLILVTCSFLWYLTCSSERLCYRVAMESDWQVIFFFFSAANKQAQLGIAQLICAVIVCQTVCHGSYGKIRNSPSIMLAIWSSSLLTCAMMCGMGKCEDGLIIIDSNIHVNIHLCPHGGQTASNRY